MSKLANMWKEIDDAVVAGFIRSMEDFSDEWGSVPMKRYGTKLTFDRNRVSHDQCREVANYIHKTYGFRVDCPFPFCVIIWEPTTTPPT